MRALARRGCAAPKCGSGGSASVPSGVAWTPAHARSQPSNASPLTDSSVHACACDQRVRVPACMCMCAHCVCVCVYHSGWCGSDIGPYWGQDSCGYDTGEVT
eukprot:4445119-Amphidinium_carterae.1